MTADLDTTWPAGKRKPPKLWLVMGKSGRQAQCMTFSNKAAALKTLATCQKYAPDWGMTLLETQCDWVDITPPTTTPQDQEAVT